MTQLHVSAALLGSEYRNSGPVTISIENGHIAEIVPAATPDGPARLAMPSPDRQPSAKARSCLVRRTRLDVAGD